MKTIREVLTLTSQYLEVRGIGNARREAEDLLCDALTLTRISLYMDHDRPLSESELKLCREYLQRRGKGEPLAYIHGKVDFCGCSIEVTPAVLIPRVETELLVEKIASTLKTRDLEGQVLWDVCCGSGYIGIALKKRFPALTVHLSDLSPAAVALAKKNALRNEVEVTIHEGDLLAPFMGQRCNYFVCNPPYVAEKEYEQLSREVRDHEPRMALVADDEGYAIYQRLSIEAPPHLHPAAKVWFEIGSGMGPRLLELFRQWKISQVEKDWAGHDRFFFLENE